MRGSPPVSPLARCNPGAAAVVMPRVRHVPSGSETVGQLRRGREEAMVAALQEPWGGWPAGWSKLNCPLPEPKVAVGLWPWKRRRQAQPGFTLYPSNDGQGLPRSSTSLLRQGMAGKVGRGTPKSNGLWSPLLQAPSSSFSQSFPAPLHCTLQDEFFVRQVSPPHHVLAPPSTFPGQEGHRVTGKVGSDCLFEAVGRQHPRLDVGSSSTQLLPARRTSSAISMLGPALPLRAPRCWPGASRERQPQKGAERIETRR